MLERVRGILSSGVKHERDLEVVLGFLGSQNSRLSLLSIDEVDGLWRMFSDERCAGFLSVGIETLNDFWYWLENIVD